MIVKKTLPSLQGGFTFLELIIVATIINVLAAIAIPAYQQYQDRAKLTEAFNLSKMAKSQIADFYRQTGRLPIDNKMAGLPTAEKLNGKYGLSMRTSARTFAGRHCCYRKKLNHSSRQHTAGKL